MFSKQFVEAFRNLEGDLENADIQTYPWDVAAGEARAFRTAYAEFMRIALKDLDLHEGGPEQ